MKMNEVMNEAVMDAGAKVGLDKSFIENIKKDDDWGVTIKCYALMETLIKLRLQECIKLSACVNLDKFVDGLPIEGRACVMELAEKFEVLDEASVRIFKLIRDIRNKYAHRFMNVQLSLDKISDNNQKIQLNELHEKLCDRTEPPSVRWMVISLSLVVFIQVAACPDFIAAWYKKRNAMTRGADVDTTEPLDELEQDIPSE